MPVPEDRKRWTRVVVVFGLLVGTVASGVGTPTAAGAARSAKADKKIASAGLIQASDLPPTWRGSATPSGDDDKFEKVAARTPSCARLVEGRKRMLKGVYAKSVDFNLGVDELNNQVRVLGSTADATRTFGLLADDSISTCYTEVLDALFATEFSDPSIQDVEVRVRKSPLVPDANGKTLGDDSFLLASVIRIVPSSGPTLIVPLLVILARVDRAISYYVFAGAPSESGQIASSTYAALLGALQAAADRVRAAQA